MDIKGLTTAQVTKSRNKYGANEMPHPRLKSAWEFFVDVFKDKLNLILLLMMVLFIVFSIIGYGSIYEAIGIGIVLLVVASTTVLTKLKAQRSAEDLRMRTSLTHATVLRNGVLQRIPATDVVAGDIVIVKAGEAICADGYVVDGNIAVNNAILNGESDECEKMPAPKGYVYDSNRTISADDYIDAFSVFGGTTVLSGEGMIRITRVGVHTENAKIMLTLHSIDEVKTTLQIQLDKLAAIISKFGSICAIAIFVILLIVNISGSDATSNANMIYIVLSSLAVSLTIFVAAVPEGLPFIIGIITGQNVNRMIRNNILAKNPNKIPEAGNIQLLCTDKTGTLTGGFLQPVHNFTATGFDMGFDGTTGGVAKELFMKNVALVNGTTYGTDGAIIGGNMTSRALYMVLKPISSQITELQHKNKILDRIAFNSANKFSAARTKNQVFFMGAPEIILKHAKNYIDDSGHVRSLNKTLINRLIKQNASRAMRLIAVAYGETWAADEKLPDDMVFISLIAMRDEIRAGVPEVVQTMSKSGVQVMMITGDNLETARAIAIDCGIVSNSDDLSMTASDLDKISDQEAKKILPNIKVIARATPGTKLRIVKLAQSLGLCIGMCGDGTNDAPALKRADVGFAMGDGTDVCKESGDIIITDNNFISIANSILLGRTFVHNVVNFLRFQLPINFSLVILSILFPILFGFDAFTAVQILIINIVMDSLNSLAFGGEPPHKKYLQEPAQGKNAPLLSRSTIMQILWTTIGFICVFALMEIPFIKNYFDTSAAYMSARFALLVVMAIVNGFCVRADSYNIFTGLSKNPMFILVAFGVIACTILCVTFGGSVLQLVPLSLNQWLIILGLSVLIIPINFIKRFLSGLK